jgi:hypothetical protein
LNAKTVALTLAPAQSQIRQLAQRIEPPPLTASAPL